MAIVRLVVRDDHEQIAKIIETAADDPLFLRLQEVEGILARVLGQHSMGEAVQHVRAQLDTTRAELVHERDAAHLKLREVELLALNAVNQAMDIVLDLQHEVEAKDEQLREAWHQAHAARTAYTALRESLKRRQPLDDNERALARHVATLYERAPLTYVGGVAT